jgi:hypothetical protein
VEGCLVGVFFGSSRVWGGVKPGRLGGGVGCTGCVLRLSHLTSTAVP